jgi:NAD(P)H-hydrate epimerase
MCAASVSIFAFTHSSSQLQRGLSDTLVDASTEKGRAMISTPSSHSSLPENLYTSNQVREGEVLAARACHVDMYSLMLRAGQAVFDELLHRYPNVKHILICCGKGNNGGDGYVVGKLALERDLAVTLWQVGSEKELKGDAATAHDAFVKAGGVMSSEQNTVPSSVDVIVDGLLGTGIKGEVRPYFAHLIERLNQAKAPIVAIDTPSGLNTDTGAVSGSAIVADYTVTFIGVKQGLVTGSARAHTGVLSFAGLGVDEVFAKQNTANALLAQSPWLEILKAKARDTHKGRQGSVLVVGGNDGMSGAAYLASCAALKSGAGLAATYVHPESCLAIRALLPEAMVSGSAADSVLLEQRSHWASALCIGPGLGRDHWGESVYKSAMQLSTKFNKPMVVDADGLYWLSVALEHMDNRVLTPHPGEAARLLGITSTQIEHDRFSAARHLQQKFGGVVVLKGAGTIICDGSTTVVCHAGNPGMATGGMGDVLAGVIASLLAQGYPVFKAAVLGTLVHSCAADRNARMKGEVGMLASDVLNDIRYVCSAKKWWD